MGRESDGAVVVGGVEERYFRADGFEPGTESFGGGILVGEDPGAVVEEIGGGRSYSGIWRKVAGTFAMEYNLTPQEYQSTFEDYSAQGYRLYRIQGYSDSDRFAAIWTK